MYAAEPARQHDHFKIIDVQVGKRTVRLHADAVTALDHAPLQRGELHVHAAAAQNITRRKRLDRLKASAQ